MFLTFKTEEEKQTGLQIMRLRSDNSGEYVSSRMKQLFGKFGIVHETTAPYSPQ